MLPKTSYIRPGECCELTLQRFILRISANAEYYSFLFLHFWAKFASKPYPGAKFRSFLCVLTIQLMHRGLTWLAPSWAPFHPAEGAKKEVKDLLLPRNKLLQCNRAILPRHGAIFTPKRAIRLPGEVSLLHSGSLF